MCAGCEFCEHCCECHGRLEIERVRRIQQELGQMMIHKAKATQHQENPTTRLIGVEIELAYGNRSAIGTVVMNWGGRIVHDGSLPPTGFEINTAPSSGDLFRRQVHEICEAGARNTPPAGVTPACGLHVHIDTRDLSYIEIRRLVMLYAALEPAFFALMPEKRRKSDFCRPCGPILSRALAVTDPVSAVEAQQALDVAIYHQDYAAHVREHGQEKGMKQFYRRLRELKAQHHNGARYHALNIHSHGYRGTVECRLFPGTAKATKIQRWGMLWAALVQHGHDMTDAQARKIGEPVAGNAARGVRVLQELAPRPDIAEWLAARFEKENGIPLAEAS
jgi:hypothetical protein